MRVPKLFPHARGWRRVLLVTTTAGLCAAVVVTAVATVVSGTDAALSAGLGAGGVIVFSFFSLALIDWSDRRAPHLSIPLFMVGFGIKVAALAAALPFVPPGGWLQPEWAVGAGVAVLLVWQAAEILSFTKMRIPVAPNS